MKGARKLAAAIRKGHTMIRESRIDYLYDGCGCAIGAAWVGSGLKEKAWPNHFVGNRILAEKFGVTEDLLEEISKRHCAGRIPRLEIAAWLDTLEPDDKAWATEQVRKLLEGTQSVGSTEAVKDPAEIQK